MYQDWLALGLKKGITDLEVFAVKNSSLKLSVYQNKVDQHVQSVVHSVTIRGIYDSKLATVRFENLKEQNIDYMLDRLIDSAKAITVVEPAIIYPGSDHYPEMVDQVFDFSSVPVIDKINLLKNLESEVLQNEFVSQVQTTQYQETSTQTSIVNSKGLNLTRNISFAYAYAAGVFKKSEDDIQTAHDIKLARRFDEFNASQMAKETIRKGVAKLGGTTIASGAYPVVFSNEMFSSILGVFNSIFSGEAAFRNLTSLKDKVGQKIFAENINLVNDPMNPTAIFKYPFDDEGVACKKRYIIDHGVFTGFNHNLKTASIFNTEPTGNAFHSGIHSANLILEPGTKSFDDLISTIEDGIYITDLVGLHAGVRTVSGDFSLQAAGQKIENGKIAYPIKMIVVSGNFFEMMKSNVILGNDLKFDTDGIASPSVYFEKLMIGGK
jgi:PmbA protein